VLDDRGLVHAYAKPLSIRDESTWATNHPVEMLGGTVGEEPLPLGLIVAAQYRAGAQWEPRTLSPGEAVLALLGNTVPAQERPGQTMAALRRAVGGSDVIALQGERGDAAALAKQLMTIVADGG
jgi:hypothetical protein